MRDISPTPRTREEATAVICQGFPVNTAQRLRAAIVEAVVETDFDKLKTKTA